MNRSMLTALSLIILIAGTALFFSLSGGANKVSLSALESTSQPTIVEIKGQKFSVEIADTVEERTQGLSDRESLDVGSGMLFIFEETRPVSFWMNRMHFPLDMIFIRDNKIANIKLNVPAPKPDTDPSDLPTYSSVEPVNYVLEINAGEGNNFHIGDKVNIRNINQI